MTNFRATSYKMSCPPLNLLVILILIFHSSSSSAGLSQLTTTHPTRLWMKAHSQTFTATEEEFIVAHQISGRVASHESIPHSVKAAVEA